MIFRYVAHQHVLDYARLGWNIADVLDGSPHGEHSILMAWLCDCPCVEPRRLAG
jgi:hypothetical protein